MADASSLIPTEVLQNLSHELYEKRKNAALEVEKIMTQLALEGDHDKITAVINLLATEFTNSPQANHRKGGLIGLAAATTGLASDAAQHLEQIVPPVLYSSSDQNSRVRYYACEALYNIAKVMRGNFIVLCNQIFEALNKLSTDSDPHVQSAACLLDKLVKDIVTEGDHYRFQFFKEEGENLGIEAGRLVHIGLTSKEIMIQLEDAECSICLCNYEEALTVQVLPCTHHFHTMCIVKWLKMQAICPLCKYNIHQGKEHA